MTRQRQQKKDIDGVFLLNKPLGLSSNAALQAVKRAYGARKAGHTGSLDPLATGMLPICFGEATKFSQYLLDADKCYRVTACLGTQTTTGDAEGSALSQIDNVNIARAQLEQAIAKFIGPIQQIPPMYSALKHQGQPLYKLARQGITVERKSRQVTIAKIDLLATDGQTFDCEVECSKGTYIRTLIEDIGLALGVGAYVSSLHRVYTKPYQEQSMLTLEQLQSYAEEQPQQLMTHLLPLDSMLGSLDALCLDQAMTLKIRNGQGIAQSSDYRQGLIRLLDHRQCFIGLGEVLSDGSIVPKRLVRQTQDHEHIDL